MHKIMTSNSHKIKVNLLSYQVRQLLNEKGFSFLWNWNDYYHFRTEAKKAFDKAQAIAEMFIQENVNSNSDFNEYIF